MQFCRTNGFPSDWVTSLCEDREGNLWVGTGSGGVVVLRPGIIKTVMPPDQWQGRAVLTVTAGRDDALWVGTEGAGVYRFHEGTWQNYGVNAGVENPYVWSVGEDVQGDLYAGTWFSGLLVRRGDRFQRAPGLEGVKAPIFAIQPARKGGLWVGTAAGLFHYETGKATWLGQKAEPALRDVDAVVEDDEGAVWFGMSSGGVGRLKDGALQQFRRRDGLSSESVQCLYLDADGSLWIGTSGGGINRLKQGHFAAIGTKQGLPNGVICNIQEDGKGFFWLSSHGGIMRVSKAELDRCADGKSKEVHCLSYGIGDGMPTLECSGGLQPAGCKTADGRLWFPTTKGLVTLDPDDVRTHALPPPVVIEEMSVDGQIVAGGMLGGSPLRIPPGRHRFEFRFTGLSFVVPEKVRFKYQLEGLEPDWADNGTYRVASYSYIPPGRYVFRVTACNSDGVWNETGAEISFAVLPYFWQTWWFRGLAALTVLASASGAVWFDARRRMRRKLERSERQHALERERARIARDIHDDLGASLTRITMLSQSAHEEPDNPARAAENLAHIYDTARELTRAMDEIVWAVDPKHDTPDSLASYLGKFAQDYLRAARIRCRLDVPVQLPGWALTSEVRHNLFLAFKEALHNVVKHAAASEVRVSMTLQTNGFSISVEDNGRGFAATAADGDLASVPNQLVRGNGLANMRRRLAEMGGVCEIQSAPGQGTRVRFTVQVNVPAS